MDESGKQTNVTYHFISKPMDIFVCGWHSPAGRAATIPGFLVRSWKDKRIYVGRGKKGKEKKRKTTQAEETLPTSIKEKETHWLRRAVSLLHHKATKKKKLMGIWSTPSGNKLVGILNRVGMKLTSKLNGTMVIQPQLFELV
eukprot:1156651-Pelagomonas_calceolata.AAC.2